MISRPPLLERHAMGSKRETLGRPVNETGILLNAGLTGIMYLHHRDLAWDETQVFGEQVAHGTSSSAWRSG
jgi:hypothetical protein